ncbi:MAG: indole-3-glycerol phosphate synthase TrpC [Robiginitalea sp.]
MNILDKIILDKKAEVGLKKKVLPESALEDFGLMARETRSLKQMLLSKSTGIIAEHKRRSPSRSVINQGCTVSGVVKGYEEAGAAGISVLTDGKYFGGSLEDLLLARASTDLPLLRKEFIVDPYQVLEAKAYGADAILLIAAVLSEAELAFLSEKAHILGLEVLLEVHNEAELEQSLKAGADLIGVNNRNLKTFEVSLQTSRELVSRIPDTVGKVSESGLGNPRQLTELKALGYHGFLMGESFMKEEDPGSALSALLTEMDG